MSTLKESIVMGSVIEQVGTIWVVYYNGKTFGSFASQAGAQAFLEVLQAPITDDGD
jgi:hypothetical protein